MATAVLVGLSELGRFTDVQQGWTFSQILYCSIYLTSGESSNTLCDYGNLHGNGTDWCMSADHGDKLCLHHQTIFKSSFCAHPPIKTHLSCWPAFPIILSYSVGEGLSISDEYNVLSALEHSNRIGTLDLTVTTTQSKQAGIDHADVIVSSSGVSGACDG